jgi:GMP synthase-like glutamine amidotransferase
MYVNPSGVFVLYCRLKRIQLNPQDFLTTHEGATMKLICLQHVAFEGPAWIGLWAGRSGLELETIGLYRNDPLPRLADFDGLVIMGGPMGANDGYRYHWMDPEKELIAQAVLQGKRVLGICLGAQLIAAALGSRVYPNPKKEIGWFPLDKTPDAGLSVFGAILPRRFTALHWHGDTFDLPPGAVHLASTPACVNQAFALNDAVLGLQFHLEATREGTEALVENCRDEMVPSATVQSEQEIRTGYGFLESAHTLMDKLLAQLFL